jgi:hypothetical protein
MKRYFRKFALAVCAVSLLSFGLLVGNNFERRAGLIPAAQAQHPFPRTRECSLGATKGRHRILTVGTELATNPFGLPAGPYSGIGIINLDGAGNGFYEMLTENINGFILEQPPGVIKFTYTVGSNCVVKSELPITPTLKSIAIGVGDPDGAEGSGTFVTPGSVHGSYTTKRID